MERSKRVTAFLSSDVGVLILVALARVILQIFTNGTYGFHQDELVTMDIASRGLAWGYVAWPPLTPFLSRVSLALFDLSPIGLRSLAVIAEGAMMVLTGLMVRATWAAAAGRRSSPRLSSARRPSPSSRAACSSTKPSIISSGSCCLLWSCDCW